METVTFKTVLYQAAARLGMKPYVDGGLSKEQIRELVPLMNARFREGWTFDWWTDLMVSEARDVTTDGTSGVHYVPWADTGKTTIGEPLTVSRQNPLLNGYTGFLWFDKDANGVVVASTAPDEVWVYSRRQPYEFTADVYDPTRTYATDDVVFYLDGDNATGECYKALKAATGKDPATETTYWEKLEFPAWMRQFVVEAVYSDGLQDEDQETARWKAENRAYEKLAGAADVTRIAAGQHMKAAADLG